MWWRLSSSGSDGRRHTFSDTTTDPGELRDERRETILYMPDEPGTATAVDALPKAALVDEGGALTAGPGIRWAILALPLLVTVVNGACVANQLR